jgi:hypothetical protein
MVCKEGNRAKQENLFTLVAQNKIENKLVSNAINN